MDKRRRGPGAGRQQAFKKGTRERSGIVLRVTI